MVAVTILDRDREKEIFMVRTESEVDDEVKGLSFSWLWILLGVMVLLIALTLVGIVVLKRKGDAPDEGRTAMGENEEVDKGDGMEDGVRTPPFPPPSGSFENGYFVTSGVSSIQEDSPSSSDLPIENFFADPFSMSTEEDFPPPPALSLDAPFSRDVPLPESDGDGDESAPGKKVDPRVSELFDEVASLTARVPPDMVDASEPDEDGSIDTETVKENLWKIVQRDGFIVPDRPPDLPD